MHDCKETKEQITELLLDGADCRSDEVLLAALRGCTDCRNEFEALNATLRITARWREISAPAESYWVDYHARLRQRIQHSANEFDAKSQRRKAEPTFFLAALRLCVTTAVPVPVPLIVAAVLAFVAVGVFAVTRAKQSIPQSPSIVHVPVEVPVVQEKIVTRVVYRERRSPTQTSKRISEPKVESTFAKFKPTDEVKLIVIKGGSPYEK